MRHVMLPNKIILFKNFVRRFHLLKIFSEHINKSRSKHFNISVTVNAVGIITVQPAFTCSKLTIETLK